jgi:hypothetical protein
LPSRIASTGTVGLSQRLLLLPEPTPALIFAIAEVSPFTTVREESSEVPEEADPDLIPNPCRELFALIFPERIVRQGTDRLPYEAGPEPMSDPSTEFAEI